MDKRRQTRWMGWMMGAAATGLYLLTLEPDVSFWDCGEFIATSYGLGVGHPPGAPFYQLLAHLFTLLAFGNTARVAWWSNALSAVAGGVAVMMLFWSLALLLRRSRRPLLGAAIGAGCYMLCDTAWFSAVESEVYSLSMAMSATMIWAMLRWATDEDRQRAGRWILLTALLLGLSVCVHQLSLLATPALLLIYLTAKRKEWSQLKKLIPLALLLFALGLTPYLIIPIRANAHPAINQGNPSTWEGMKHYMARDQYEKAPLWPRRWRHHKHDDEYSQTWASKGGDWEYLASYQIWYMYGRYLMWNFGGRYNDRQGYGSMMNGQCITGIPFIDRPIVGTAAKMPESLPRKGHNRYFMLPLLLGLIGMLSHRRLSKRGFWMVMALFLMGGLILNLYLNHPCYEPRERDYAYVLSFYAFAIWIGIGAATLAEKWGKCLPYTLLLIPALMGWQNYDDHDRSHRYLAADTAHNMLNSCDQGALLLTAGDNDTFPLWYAQEVEGFRTDVEVRNISLMGGTRRMLEKVYAEIEARPIYLTHYAYNSSAQYFEGMLGLSGFGYRIVPEGCDSVLAQEAYRHAMNDLGWRKMEGVYVDEVSGRFLEQYYKDMLLVAENLMDQGDADKGRDLLAKTMEEIPWSCIQDPNIMYKAACLMGRESDSAALSMSGSLRERLRKELDYFNTIDPKRQRYIGYTLQPRREVMRNLQTHY